MCLDIPGADAVVRWFGEWPTFHDAELMSLRIIRGHESELRVHAWLRGPVDASGAFRRINEGIVAFKMSGISSFRMEGEDVDRQNVLHDIAISRSADGYRIELRPSYGMWGEIVVSQLSLEVDPLQ